MSTTTRQPFFQRNKWVLPVLLALLIIAVVAGVILAQKLKSAAKATPTPTPTVRKATVVVTATPPPAATPKPGRTQHAATGATPTATSSAAATATATGGTGSSTPLPGATAVPTVPGLHLGMITHKTSDVNRIQSGANSGNSQYTYYLNPIQVVKTNLPTYGFTAPVQIVSPAQPSPSPTATTDSLGRPLIKVIVQFNGKRYEVDLVQPATRGPKGIWLIVTIRQLGP